jgi:Flp pilus assembly pilin Flp
MKRWRWRLLKELLRQNGQGIPEYALLVGLVAAGLLGLAARDFIEAVVSFFD